MSNHASSRWADALAFACVITLGTACVSSSDPPASSSSGGSTAQPAGTGGTTTQPTGTGGTALVTSSGGAATPSLPSTGGQTGQATGGAQSSGGTTSPRGSGGASSAGGAKGGGSVGTVGGAAGTGAPMGTAGEGGPSLCPVAGTTLCDGFETAVPGAAGSDWTTMGMITADTTKFYRGAKSVKFSGSLTYILEKKTFTGTTKMTNNNLWVRYFFLSNQASVAAAPATHVWYGALADSMNSGNQFHFAGGSRGKLQAEIRIGSDKYTDAMVPAAGTTSPNYPILSDGWQCWEFHVQEDDSFEFFINGKEVTEMKIVAGKASKSGAIFSPMPIFAGLYLGWQDFSGSSLTGWLDEVAVGPNRIGCGN